MNAMSIPKNLIPHQNAEVVVFLPGKGMLRVACGSGDNLDDEDRRLYDEHNRLIDNYVMIYTYTSAPQCGVWERNECGFGCMRMDGMMFGETDGGQMLYSSGTYPTGDIRDLLVPALYYMEWPTDLTLYHLVATAGEFAPKKKRKN